MNMYMSMYMYMHHVAYPCVHEPYLLLCSLETATEGCHDFQFLQKPITFHSDELTQMSVHSTFIHCLYLYRDQFHHLKH